MKKIGQLQISFGMIFSVIIIIATVAVGFYVINYFMELSNCTKLEFFRDSLEREVDKAWQADISQKPFEEALPSGIEKVCFGNESQTPLKADLDAFNFLKERGQIGDNAMFYPSKKACDGEMALFKLKHIKTERFFCVPVKSGKAKIKIIKEISDNLVKLSAG